MADNFLTFSQRGMSSKIWFQPFLSNVLFKAEIKIIFPILEAFSEKETKSSKNWPSSIPITSKQDQSWSEISESFLQQNADLS